MVRKGMENANWSDDDEKRHNTAWETWTLRNAAGGSDGDTEETTVTPTDGLEVFVDVPSIDREGYNSASNPDTIYPTEQAE